MLLLKFCRTFSVEQELLDLDNLLWTIVKQSFCSWQTLTASFTSEIQTVLLAVNVTVNYWLRIKKAFVERNKNRF